MMSNKDSDGQPNSFRSQLEWAFDKYKYPMINKLTEAKRKRRVLGSNGTENRYKLLKQHRRGRPTGSARAAALLCAPNPEARMCQDALSWSNQKHTKFNDPAFS